MNPKAYMEEAERLRHRLFRKEHEIDCIRQSAEGMVGKGGDSPKTVSPEPHKMEIAVEKILSLEEEIEETKMELQHLMHEMRKQIQKVADADARDLLTKRYLEFKPWKVVASELDYSVQHIYYLHNKALEKLRVHQSS